VHTRQAETASFVIPCPQLSNTRRDAKQTKGR
jgi:hypothetical protein